MSDSRKPTAESQPGRAGRGRSSAAGEAGSASSVPVLLVLGIARPPPELSGLPRRPERLRGGPATGPDAWGCCARGFGTDRPASECIVATRSIQGITIMAAAGRRARGPSECSGGTAAPSDWRGMGFPFLLLNFAATTATVTTGIPVPSRWSRLAARKTIAATGCFPGTGSPRHYCYVQCQKGVVDLG